MNDAVVSAVCSVLVVPFGYEAQGTYEGGEGAESGAYLATCASACLRALRDGEGSVIP